MNNKTISMIAAVLASSALAGAAMAHPGGGGGGGGGFGGGVGGGAGGFGGGASNDGGNGFGRGDVGGNGSSTFGRSNLNDIHGASADAGRSVNANSSTTLLDKNDKVDTALTKELTRKGIALPAGGLKTACAGFANLGQCVAALHVAKNLDIPGGFDALKTAVLAPHGSLGEAITKLRPSADSIGETNKATRQADNDLKG